MVVTEVEPEVSAPLLALVVTVVVLVEPSGANRVGVTTRVM